MNARPTRRTLTALLGALLFLGALWILHRELARQDPVAIRRAVRSVPSERIVWASLATAASYGLLTLYDVLGLRHAGRRLSYARTALVSFTSYVASHNLGLSGIGGTAVRYRLYTAFGLSTAEIAEVVASVALAFWMGFLALSGIVFVAWPIPLPEALQSAFASTRPIGGLLLVPAAGFFVWVTLWRKPLRVRAWRFDPPTLRVVLLQLPISALDWGLGAAVVYALLPSAPDLGIFRVLAAFLAAQMLGMVSHVPAGLGIFETVFLFLLPPDLRGTDVIGALLVYRAVYYLAPLALGTVLFLGTEGVLRRRHLVAFGQGLVPMGELLLPRALALTVAGAGAVLLVTGTLPTTGTRMAWLREVIPLPVVELSHFLGSLLGAGMLLLGRGLARRIDAAWWLSVLALAVGIPLTLLRGLDLEEAGILAFLLLLLLPFRRTFHRRASLLRVTSRAPWMELVLVLGASAWLGLLVHRHVEYSQDLWWRFAYEADAPRFLRASAGALGVCLLFGIARLLRSVPPPQPVPTEADLGSVSAILAREPETLGHLALLGDKHLLFDASRTAFVMYAIQGRSWIALGDPVGGEEATRRELVWRLRERAENAGGRAVFYQVGEANLGWYAETGCTLLKLGEEARVDLAAFKLEGRSHKGLRAAWHRAERANLAFEVLPAAEVPARLPALRGVSDRWLATRNAREKGFSLGFFELRYLSRGPMAIVTRHGVPMAFANVLCGAPGGELSVDLMRHEPEAEGGVMDFLFLSLFEWGRARGYRWFSLGMAPLSGLEERPAAPAWNRVAALVTRHGEHFYNFRGLRRYKDKFDPVWRPRYLASPGGLALPGVLFDVSARISSGPRRVLGP